MTGSEPLLLVTLIIMLIGLAGSFLPGVPGVPLIFLSALLYGIYTNFEEVGILILVLLFVFAAIAFIADFAGTSYGARKFGASNWGTVGGAIGGIAGALVGTLFLGIGSLFGLILGTIGGVFLGEYLRRERQTPDDEGSAEAGQAGSGRDDWRRASRAAGGVLVGYLISAIAQAILGVASVVVFVLALIY